MCVGKIKTLSLSFLQINRFRCHWASFIIDYGSRHSNFKRQFSSVNIKKTFKITATVHVTLFFDEFFVLFTNQLVQMSLSFCHHWSWIQTLKRPPYMIRGLVFFYQGRRPQGWWRCPAPGAHSLCCPRKTECCWNRDSVAPRRHFEGLKRPPRIM